MTRSFNFEILDKRHLIAIGQEIAYGIAYLHATSGSLARSQFGRRHPLAGLIIVHVIVFAHWVTPVFAISSSVAGVESRSITKAMPCPPPMHMVTRA